MLYQIRLKRWRKVFFEGRAATPNLLAVPKQLTEFGVGSCVASVRGRVTETHATDEGGCHLLGVEQHLIRGHIQMQIRLMNPTKHPQICAQGRACPFATVAMH